MSSNQQDLQSLPHPGQVTPEVFFEPRLLRTQEGISETDQTNVMMPTQPMAPLVVIQPQLFFQFPVVQFDPPARLGHSYQTAHSRRLPREVSQPVFGRFSRCLGPFDQQPLTRRALGVSALAIREQPRPGGRAKRERCGPRLAWRQVSSSSPKPAAARPPSSDSAAVAKPPSGG